MELQLLMTRSERGNCWYNMELEAMSTAEKLNRCREAVMQEYSRDHSHPWVIAYSGGKDSTLLLQIIWEVVGNIRDHARQREIHVVGNDTLVESPLVIKHLRDSLDRIANVAKQIGLKFQTHITRPHIDQTFWVNVIGRGYIPPTRNFRWCTDRMKILPTSQLLERLVRRSGSAILLVGTRKSESEERRRNMSKRQVSGVTLTPHGSIVNCHMFAPLAELDDEDVWKVLMQRQAPWGGTHKNLITLYRNAGGGECPLILSKDDSPSCGTTSPRFGCWTCTVVAKDRSMRGLIASGHRDAATLELLFDFREWLIQLREDEDNRQKVRRDGNTRNRADGSRVLGPFKIDVRKHILEKLTELEKQVGSSIISMPEIEIIHDIWRRDSILEDCRLALDGQREFVNPTPSIQ